MEVAKAATAKHLSFADISSRESEPKLAEISRDSRAVFRDRLCVPGVGLRKAGPGAGPVVSRNSAALARVSRPEHRGAAPAADSVRIWQNLPTFGAKIRRARSRLYRSRFFRNKIRFAACFKIYKRFTQYCTAPNSKCLQNIR